MEEDVQKIGRTPPENWNIKKLEKWKKFPRKMEESARKMELFS